MKTIKDPLHDHIAFDEFALELLDTPEMQRLRNVRQLGTAYLVYPSANHSRFEHSMGVYHLAVEALDNLDVDDTLRDEVRAAALVHDIGHTPFSHNVEEVVADHVGVEHDEVDDLLDGDVGRVLTRHGVEPDRVAELIQGEGKYGQLVSGELDVDRMDYLVRDAYHTGVPYGTIDNRRLVLELDYVDGELVLGEGNVQTAEALLIARALMHPTVYNHHVARISKAMLRRATRRLVESGVVSAEEIRRMDDHDFVVELRSHPETRETERRLSERRLYKQAVWLETHAVADDALERPARDVEEEVAERAGVDSGDVLVDVSSPPDMVESGARVVVDGEVRGLREESRLVEGLERMQGEQDRFGVYCPEDVVSDVEEAARSLYVDRSSAE